MNDKRITIRLPASILNIVNSIAGAANVKSSKFIRDAIKYYIVSIYKKLQQSYDKEEN